MENIKVKNILFNLSMSVLLVGFIIIARLTMHISNFTPLIAISMFSGMIINFQTKSQKSNWGLLNYLIPFIGMGVSDLFLPKYPIMERAVVYFGFFITFFIGFLIKKITNPKELQKYNAIRIYGSTFLGSLAFYLVTNCVWLYYAQPVLYPHTIAGQVQSYVNALPFFRNQLCADMIYSTIIFGVYYFVIWQTDFNYNNAKKSIETQRVSAIKTFAEEKN